MFNPEVVVVCGGVTLAGDHLFVPLRREVARGARSSRPSTPAASCPASWAAPRACTAPPRRSWTRRPRVPKVGVVGSLVWDLIHGRDPLAPPTEEWGGIAYALGGLDASLPPDWEIVPLIKVGRDLAPRRPSCCGGLARLTPGGRCVEVPAPNNRVVLHYQSAERRCERMSGGVPGWTWLELGPMVRDLDALYLNFISGFELALGTAQALRQGFHGPIYADLHSLFLGMQHDGIRVLQPLPEPPAWFGCFDVVQLNEDEMRQLSPDPLSLAAQALGAGVSLLVVTLGARGAAYVAAPGFDGWRCGRRGVVPASGGAIGRGLAASVRSGDRRRLAVRTALIPAPRVDALDPTGCGDVFGAAACARLLAGDAVEAALRHATAMAARNAALPRRRRAQPPPPRRAAGRHDPGHRGARDVRRPVASSSSPPRSARWPPEEKVLIDARGAQWASPYGLLGHAHRRAGAGGGEARAAAAHGARPATR